MKTSNAKNRKVVVKKMTSIAILLAIFLSIPLAGAFGQANDSTKKYDKIDGYRDDGYAKVYLNGKEGLIDKSRNEVAPCKYDDIRGTIVIYKNGHETVYFVEGFAIAKRDGGYGYIDESGKEITPFKYSSDIRPFSEGMAMVIADNKVGYIDSSGAEVIACKYDDGWIFESGTASVKLDGKQLYIDKQGNEYPTKKAAKKALKARNK